MTTPWNNPKPDEGTLSLNSVMDLCRYLTKASEEFAVPRMAPVDVCIAHVVTSYTLTRLLLHGDDKGARRFVERILTFAEHLYDDNPDLPQGGNDD